MKKLALALMALVLIPCAYAQTTGDSTSTAYPLPAALSGSGPGTCTKNSANSVCLTAAPYYASPAGATTTTITATTASGVTSLPVASCSTFLPNQGVLVTGAGASGANLIATVSSCTGTTMVVSTATSSSLSTGSVIQHDETSAFNLAVTNLAALPVHGGNIYGPDGIYLVNGPLQDTSGANAIIPMPKIANYATGTLVDIAIKGYTAPNWDTSASGMVIMTSAPTGNLFGGYDSATGGGYPPLTNVKLSFENVTLRAPANPGVVMINGTNLMALSVSHILVNTTTSALPTNTAGGAIYMPALLNEVENFADDVQIGGYGTAWRMTEHTRGGSVFAVNSINCFVFDSGKNSTAPSTYNGNSVSIQYLWTENCTNSIVGGTSPIAINVLTADLEQSGTYDILDASNYLHGSINYLNPYNSSKCTVTKSGGSNLQLTPLYCALAAAGNGVVAYGVPALASAAAGGTGISTASSPQDNSFALYVTTNATQAAGTTIATIAFGKTWVTSSGSSISPVCSIQGEYGAQNTPLIIGSVSSTQVALVVPAGVTYPANAGLTYGIQCSGYGESGGAATQFAYGTPTLTQSSSANDGLSISSATQDNSFAFYINNSSSTGPGVNVVSFGFGKSWVNAAGTAVSPVCTVQGVSGAENYPLQISNISSTQIALTTRTGTTIPANTGLTYGVQCSGYTEQ